MKKKFTVLCFTAVMAISITACSGNSIPGSSSKSTESTASQQEASGETQETTEQSTSKGIWDSENRDVATGVDAQKEQELYNSYIDINNFMVGRLGDSLVRYFKYVAEQEEFSPLETDYDCYSIMSSLFDQLENAYSLASEKTEKDELDNAFLAMYPSIKQIMTTLNEIYDYTDMKSYLDDDYAKGKEYHATLWAALGEYAATGDTFMNELDEVAAEHNAAFLEEIKAQGMDVLYAVNMVLNSAQAIQQELYLQEITDENLLEMDLEAVQPLYEEFVKYVEEVLEYSKDEAKLSEEGLSFNTGSWSMFLSSMKSTKTSMTELIQHVKDQEPLSYSDTLITIAGHTSIASYEQGVSDMIGYYNSLIGY